MSTEHVANKQVARTRPGRRIWAGLVDYDRGQEIQKRLVGERQIGAVPDTLLLLEHPVTYTIGRSGGENNLLVSEKEIEAIGGTVHRVDRGGDITFHGPGQLVGYPIVDLNEHYKDVHRYLRDLEEVLIRVLNRYRIRAERVAGLSGVWVGQDKVAAMGVHVSRWVTSHGFALNVSTDLAHFGRIIPCGIQDRGVTSMERLLGRKLSLEELAEATAAEFADVFGLNWEPDKWVPV